MTRINVGIDPEELPGKLLIAEQREITRIPNAIRSGKANLNNLPDRFSLGEGHVRFFYDKLGYLRDRYIRLLEECRNRKYNVTDKTSSFDGHPEELMGEWEPAYVDRLMVETRIRSKGFELIEKIPA